MPDRPRLLDQLVYAGRAQDQVLEARHVALVGDVDDRVPPAIPEQPAEAAAHIRIQMGQSFSRVHSAPTED